MNFKKYLPLVTIIFFLSCSSDRDDNLTAPQILNLETAIKGDSDLFFNLQEIASDDERPEKTIACIDFIYPITLFVFDKNNDYLYTSKISDDNEFSAFLEPIGEEQSISISFPISSVLNSGEELIIENKEELKESIDKCLNIEIVGECETLLRECLWKVGYSFEVDNDYLGSILQESDGFLVANTLDDISIGSWTPLIIENDLHININIIDTTAVGEYFNYDWKAEYLDENSLKLTYEDKELILNQRCDPDFSICRNFSFESCKTDPETEGANFILDEFTFCIFDTLELDLENENFTYSYHRSEEDAVAGINHIASDEIYTSPENLKVLYVRINDLENDIQFYVIIELKAINC